MTDTPPRSRVLVTRRVTRKLAESLWMLYERAFVEIEDKAIGTQLIARGDFLRLVDAADTYKVIGLVGDQPAGMILLTNHVELIPGINSVVLEARYPEQWARREVYYVPFAFAVGQRRSLRLYSSLVAAASQVAAVRNGVIVVDMCRYLVEAGQVNLINRALRDFPDSIVEEIDAQVYFGLTLPEPSTRLPAAGDREPELVIDLTDEGTAVEHHADGAPAAAVTRDSEPGSTVAQEQGRATPA